MTTSTTTRPAHIDPCTFSQIIRVDRRAVPAVPTPAECGHTSWARDVATALCATLRGETWRAETRTPHWPSELIEQRSQLAVVVDLRVLVVITETKPAGGGIRERWTIGLNGRYISHRVFRRELPHAVEPISRSVWLARNGVTAEPCDRLLCDEPATHATWDGSFCPTHV